MATVNRKGRFILRWVETCDSALQEHLVEVISSQQTKTVLRSTISLQEHTAVLLADDGAGGTVQSCYKEGGAFILTISLKDEINMPSSEPQRDPGLLAIDDFLSEAQEAELLKHWNA